MSDKLSCPTPDEIINHALRLDDIDTKARIIVHLVRCSVCRTEVEVIRHELGEGTKVTTVAEEQHLYEHFLSQVLDKERMEKAYAEVVEFMVELNRKKTEDYNSNDVTFAECWPEGTRDLWLGLSNKVLRLKSLVGRDGPVQQPNFESIEDNGLDLAAYSVWFVVLNQLAKNFQGGQHVEASAGSGGGESDPETTAEGDCSTNPG